MALSAGFANQDATDRRLFNIVDPEKMLTYELGIKSQWFDNRVRLNGDMYYSEYIEPRRQASIESPYASAAECCPASVCQAA